MVSVTVNSRLPSFIREKEEQVDDVVLGLAGEIERLTKIVIPHNKGILQSSVRVDKVEPMHYKVTAGEFPNLAYAERMEFDENLNYSKPGKKAHALGDSGDTVASKAMGRIKAIL